jgi:hypothetical protein
VLGVLAPVLEPVLAPPVLVPPVLAPFGAPAAFGALFGGGVHAAGSFVSLGLGVALHAIAARQVSAIMLRDVRIGA